MSRELPEGVDGSAIVNQSELARAFNVSTTTIQDWTANPDMPVEQRGGNGVAWSFRLGDVWEWRQEKLERDARDQAKADEAVNQLRMALVGETADGDDFKLSAAERIKEMQAQAEWMKIARQRRELVRSKDMQSAVERLMLQFAAVMDAVPDELGDRLGLTPDQQETVAAYCDQKRSGLHKTVSTEFYG